LELAAEGVAVPAGLNPLVPVLFLALTQTKYAVPLVRPVIMQDKSDVLANRVAVALSFVALL
jgi:hypothetical protein